MNKKILLFFTAVILYFTACHRTEAPAPAQEFGYLSLNIGLQIEESSAGRIEAVSPDNFLVTIHDASDGSEVMRWDTYLEVLEEVQLPTGSYFVRATNLEFPADAAFEQPWYFGESDVFTIDKEELKTIDVECTLANCKISFNYSQNVLDNFTNWDATATIDDGNGTGAFLEWIQSDASEGYFLTDLSIDIEVYLEYIKELPGTDPPVITRTFNHTITDPQPATHYLVNVDASLEDGKIRINITVNDDFETVEVLLGDEVVPPEPIEPLGTIVSNSVSSNEVSIVLNDFQQLQYVDITVTSYSLTLPFTVGSTKTFIFINSTGSSPVCSSSISSSSSWGTTLVDNCTYRLLAEPGMSYTIFGIQQNSGPIATSTNLEIIR